MNIVGEKFQHQKFSRTDLVVLDKNVAEFSVEPLNNCSIVDAIKILHYKRKFDSNFYHLYWRGILKTSPKYLQKISIRNRWKNYVLIENIIAKYLCEKEVLFDDEWIYVGYHDWSGYRIIVGRGPLIILSRFVPDNISHEFESTKLYLRRLKITDPLVFATTEELRSAKMLDLDDILNFAEKDNSIKPIFEKDHKIISFCLWIVIFILSFVIIFDAYKISQQDYRPNNRDNKIKNENLTVYSSSKNYDQLKNLLMSLNDNLHWNRIAKFCEQNKIKIYELKIDKDFAKIKTKLSVKELKKLKNVKADYIVNSEYEKLGVDQITEAVLWLKLN